MTRREDIERILSEKEISLQQLANALRITMKELLEDLEHVKYSIRPRKIKSTPAFCKKCNFIFREREKLKPPTKCPRCRSEWIQAAVYKIE